MVQEVSDKASPLRVKVPVDRLKSQGALRVNVVDRRGLGYLTRPSAPVHVVFAVVLLRQIPVMGVTHQFKILRTMVAATRIGLLVVEL